MNRLLLTRRGLVTAIERIIRHAAVALLVLLLPAGFASLAQAQSAGQVTHLSGPLFGVKADGARQVLSVNSAVDPGDTLITEAKTYARVKFTDASEITLRPDTQFKIENYAFVQADPAKDNALFSLFKGALRTITGLVGKRGNQDAYRMSTPTATIGIRGTQYIAELVPDTATAVSLVPYALPLLASADLDWMSKPSINDVGSGLFSLPAPDPQAPLLAQVGLPGGGPLPPGLYVQVLDGQIHLSNSGGSQLFSAGQFGFVPDFGQPPVILPTNPGIIFTPPPQFGGLAPGSGPTLVSPPSGAQTNEGCEVR
jgi:hypothetical protein